MYTCTDHVWGDPIGLKRSAQSRSVVSEHAKCERPVLEPTAIQRQLGGLIGQRIPNHTTNRRPVSYTANITHLYPV